MAEEKKEKFESTVVKDNPIKIKVRTINKNLVLLTLRNPQRTRINAKIKKTKLQ